MYRGIAIISLLLAGFIVYPQQIPQHTKKIYVSPEGVTYIQKDLPVYLWLSTDAGNSSEKYRLHSDATKQYSNPLYFDSEGYNTFRSPSAVDTQTHKTILPLRDIVFEVYADGTPPATKIDYGKTVPVTIQGKIHTGSSTLISLTSFDKISGVENIYYSIDEGAYTIYSGSFPLQEEKEYRICFYAVDHVGNVEELRKLVIVYDKSVPVTKLTIEGDQFENTISGRSKIVLKAEDLGAGMKNILFKLDNNPEKAYTVPIAAAYIAQGEHTMKYYAIDKVGNTETTKTYDFYVDKTPPTIIEEVIGNSYISNNVEYSSGKARLKLTSFDNRAGVKEIRYSVNNAGYEVYNGPVFLTQSSGNIVVKSYAVDNVNNRSVSQSANDRTSMPYIDLTGPEIKYSFNGPVFRSRDTIFINKKTEIVLRGNDLESGMHRVEYTTDTALLVYTKPFSIDKEGYNTITCTGYDNVDNSGTLSFGFKMDNEGPSISYVFGTSVLSREAEIPIYPAHTVLFVSATDPITGFRNMKYKINDGTIMECTGFIKNLKPGKNKVTVEAYDMLGNRQEIQVEFIIR